MPSQLVAPDPGPGVWHRDRALMLAYTIHQQNLCSECGYPKEICRNQERFEAKQEYCNARAAIERAQQDNSKKPNGEIDPGLLLIPVYKPAPEL